ncbi:phytanoyl-CoA dioxygenase family protein [Pararobbsia silviterrae]|uniref:Phytanoyl-CoA dioxygenase family protein n=1 Tax=Pararobbsia silviterrae TaxID=1792498 RepID=A0A494YCL5_9BURK|nr:phytanoyl-CoA dioxygenase family protein [Pararobbsia silviterrae]RKP58458.1 phytanoyl-CoA dioxygenase family protein [Pararobbsia silviterrae]
MAGQHATQQQIEVLRDKGFVVVPGFIPDDALANLNATARAHLAARAAPLEFEADLQYPGAPSSRDAAGGETVRRLLDAYAREPLFAQWGASPQTGAWMREYFGERVFMSRAHHNCLMTKHPLYGSLTGWHRDIRYWSFTREDLVSVWLALGDEEIDNGALWFVPGSHRMPFDASRFDEAKFFRADHAENAALIRTAESPRLAPGDAVFFHCNTLHSAGKNLSDAIKFSLVFTYRGESNPPVAGTRSTSKPEIELEASIGSRV